MAYRQQREHTKHILKTTQENKWKDFISTLNHCTNRKQIWDTIQQFNHKPFKAVDTIIQNNIRYTDNNQKAEILTKHYGKVSSDKS